MKRYDLYGSSTMSMNATAEAVASVLGITFELHDSMFLGGDYWLGVGPAGDKVTVQPNAEDDEGYLIEEDFPSHPVLVYVNGSDEEIERALEAVEGFALLRSKTV